MSIDAIRQHIRADFESEREGEIRPPRFRMSSLPFCSIIFAEDHYKPEREKLGLKAQFFFKAGHMLHDLWQDSRVNGRLGHLCYGNWECRRCKSRDFPEGLRPSQHTKCCGAEWKYVELEINLGPLSGHIDMITYDPEDDEWTVWDLKSTGFEILKYRAKKTLPFASNINQIYGYAVVIKRLYGISVKRACLYYISRERPDYDLSHPHILTFDRDRQEQEARRIDRAMEGYLAAKELIDNPTMENVKRTVDARPCYSALEYEQEMKHGFFRSDCPHYHNGSCAKSRVPFMDDHLASLYLTKNKD